jgi:ribosome biogenesis GTPase / thiamine phosphate phosphatase
MSRIDIEAYEDEWEDDEVLPAPSARPRRTHQEGTVGRVIGLHKGWVDVVIGGEELEAVYGGSMRGEQVVVGDRVRVRLAHSPSDTARVVDRLERGTILMRTADDAVEEERLLAANVDLVVVVLGSEDPEEAARFADRVLVAAEAGDLEAAVCMNKIDLLGSDPSDAADAVLARYAPLDYDVVRTSALTGDGLEDLRALLAGRWSVLTGHSGVGKTSLTNRLVPGVEREVGEVGRFGGRHTTVSPRAMRVPRVADAWIVDTPGVRSFGVAHVPPDDLWYCFPELRGLDCELPGCLHVDEPGCGLPGVLGERIHPERYASYRRLLAALRGEGI